MPSKHKRGVGKVPGAIRLLVPQQVVQVIGATRVGDVRRFRVKLSNGDLAEIPASWIGGEEIANAVFDAYQGYVFDQAGRVAQDRQRGEAERRRLTYELMGRPEPKQIGGE